MLDARADVRVPDEEAHRRIPHLLAWFMAEGRRLLWNNIAAFWARAIDQFLDGPIEQLAQDQAIRLTRLRVLLTADDRRPLHPRSGQDDRLSPHRAKRRATPSRSGPFRGPDGWRRCRPTSTLPTNTTDAPASAATCRSVPTTSGRTRRRCSPTRTTATSSRSIRSTRRPTRRAWDRFLKEFNEFATTRNGIPLLNQSPFVTRAQCEQAFGAALDRVQPLGAIGGSGQSDGESVFQGVAVVI